MAIEETDDFKAGVAAALEWVGTRPQRLGWEVVDDVGKAACYLVLIGEFNEGCNNPISTFLKDTKVEDQGAAILGLAVGLVEARRAFEQQKAVSTTGG